MIATPLTRLRHLARRFLGRRAGAGRPVDAADPARRRRRGGGRRDAEPVGAAPGERAPAPAARRPQPHRQAPAADRRRSRAPGAPGQPRPRLAAGAAHRPARTRCCAGIAQGFRLLLAPEVAAARPAPQPKVARRDDRPDPGDGGGESAVGRRAHPRRAAEARHPRGKRTIQRYLRAGPPAAPRGPDVGDLPAQPRRARSGPATSCRSPTCSSARSTPSSSSRSARAGWSMSA